MGCMRENKSRDKGFRSTTRAWTIRHRFEPEDISRLVRLHGILYAEEYGFDETFERYVADGLAELETASILGRNRIWLAERGDRMIGSIAIVARSEREAQLRWFLVDREFRGQGLGRRLMKRALLFCREQGFERVFLWTTSELVAARRVYMRFGFRKTEEKTHTMWGKDVTEERYDLRLSDLPLPA